MSCCDWWSLDEDDGVVGECPDCGEETTNGRARRGCNWSPVICETCGAQPCDESC